MILQANKSHLSNPSRPWRFVMLTSVLAAVLGMSLVTLRPTASAQDGADRSEIKQRKSSAKKKRNKPGRDERALPPATQSASDKAIELSLQVLEVDQHKLAQAELSFDELVVQTTGDTCQLIDGVIVAANDPQPLAGLITKLREGELATVISTPKLITLDQQEATVQIGSQVPLVKIEETVNGQSTGRVEYKDVGVQLTIKPTLSPEVAGNLTLDVAIECSRLLPPRGDADTESASPVLRTRKMHIMTDAELGQAVLIAEPQPKRNKKAERQTTLLVVIAPAHVISPPQPNPVAHPPAPADKIEAALAKLHAENDELRKQVAQLRKRLADAQVQLAWLRDAATAAGREKVSDEVFLRRVYLDLTGVLPTSEDAKTFINDKDAEKRSKLIDRLLPSAQSRAFLDETWKDLIKQRVAADSAASPPPPAAESDPRVVKIFALKDTPAQHVIEVIKQLQQEGKAKIELHGIAADERTNSIVVSGKNEELVIVGALIAALDKTGTAPAETQHSRQTDELTQRLRALDVREAEIHLRAAQTRLERIQSMAKTNPASVAQEEVLTAQLEADKAALQLESLKSGDDPLAKQKNEVRLAEIHLRAAMTKLERLSTLAKQGGTSQTELDVARFEAEKAEIEVERAKARLEGRQK